MFVASPFLLLPVENFPEAGPKSSSQVKLINHYHFMRLAYSFLGSLSADPIKDIDSIRLDPLFIAPHHSTQNSQSISAYNFNKAAIATTIE
jgi:hypothetical protein